MTARTLQITSATPDPALLDLPWQVPLEQWPVNRLATLPRGISRHVVRFVQLSGHVLAAKEITESFARREYELLRLLRRLGLPAVEPLGVVTGRVDAEGNDLDPVLLTRHLQFSLPYRAAFSQSYSASTGVRLIDALAILLVRLHLSGFYWGDVSLSNVLFRRDAGAFAAYLVDAETGDLHDTLSDGQRSHDLDVAHMNVAGELMDLQAGGLLDESTDPLEIAGSLLERYSSLWSELTAPEAFEPGDRWRVDARIRRLNELGFDVGELNIATDVTGTSIEIQPKVVDAGHHRRRLLRLTGLNVEENQARRLLNDLDTYRAAMDKQGVDEDVVAHEWLARNFEATVRAVPLELRGKLAPAELYHEVLEHRWYLSENQGRDVGLDEAVSSYIGGVLVHKPDEAAVLGVDTEEIPVVSDMFDEDGLDASPQPLPGTSGASAN
ncbi:DUF4032 domain-containing protein [Spongisporangium articulatum]|uniref:DUF4032 domain-containing protein n=1 Tax=Spongisporangium articulatum TaxID=3362603 RepID=A0ABW8AKH9_9ACTN